MVVRNLRQSLVQGGVSVPAEPAGGQNGSAPQKKTRVAVLISGTGQRSAKSLCGTSLGRAPALSRFLSCVPGTNLQALIQQAQRPCSSAHIVLVISNRPGVPGLKRAALAGIQTRVSSRCRHRWF